MTLFETFKEWITTSKYDTLLEENKLLDLQMKADKSRMIEYQHKIQVLEALVKQQTTNINALKLGRVEERNLNSQEFIIKNNRIKELQYLNHNQMMNLVALRALNKTLRNQNKQYDIDDIESNNEITRLRKENLEKHNLLHETLKSRDALREQFNKSQENHAGYKYYKAKYLLCHNEFHDIKKKLSHLEDIATETEHLSKMLNDAQLEIRDLKYQLEKKPKLKCAPGLRQILNDTTINHSSSEIKISKPQNCNIPNVIDNREDDSYLTDKFKIGSIVWYTGKDWNLRGYWFKIVFINYDVSTATIESIASEHHKFFDISFADLELKPIIK